MVNSTTTLMAGAHYTVANSAGRKSEWTASIPRKPCGCQNQTRNRSDATHVVILSNRPSSRRAITITCILFLHSGTLLPRVPIAALIVPALQFHVNRVCGSIAVDNTLTLSLDVSLSPILSRPHTKVFLLQARLFCLCEIAR